MKYINTFTNYINECQLLFSLVEDNNYIKKMVPNINWKKDFQFIKNGADMFKHYSIYLKNFTLYGRVGDFSYVTKNIFPDKIPYKEIHFGLEQDFQNVGMGSVMLKAIAYKFNDEYGNIRIIKGRIINSNVDKVLNKMKHDKDVEIIENEYYYEIKIK